MVAVLSLCWQTSDTTAQNNKQINSKMVEAMNFEMLIPKIAKGFDINQGEIVLLQLWGENKDLPILDKFAIEIAKAGGIPVKWQYSREFIKEYFFTVPQENLKWPEKYFDIFKSVDIVIDILTYSPAPAPGFPKERMPFYGQYMGTLFKTLTQKKYFIQVKVPTPENAQEEGLDYEIFNSALLNALDIDYSIMKKKCTDLTAELKSADNVKIYTKDKNLFSFSLKGREWYKDDGTGDIPCGEVYISPIEESGEGQIFVPEIIIEGQKYSDVLLAFNKGKLVKASSPEILDYIRSAPGDCDVLAEFGIGLNPGVKELIGYAGTDEKCIGTVHVAVGMNNLAGGKNKSPMHYDFIIRPDKIEIDGIIIIKNGRFAENINKKLDN
jgi:leucyl aminopeptidase (aminopeptidase T)